MVPLELGKTKLAGEARTYAKRLTGGVYGTVQGMAGLDAGGLVGAGMRKGDAKLLMGRASQKCTSSGGEGSSANDGGSGSGSANGTESSGGTTSLVSMVDTYTYAIAASKAGAVAAVNAIKGAEPVPELVLKGKTCRLSS